MAIQVLSFLSLILLVLSSSCIQGTANGDYGGGWEGAHATFYGGGDASGTMGMPCFPSSIRNRFSVITA